MNTHMVQGIDRKRLAKLTVECYLEQLLTYGFFHAGEGSHPPDGWRQRCHAPCWCLQLLAMELL